MELSKGGWPIVLGIALVVSASGTGTAPVLEIGVRDRANAYASLVPGGAIVAWTSGSAGKTVLRTQRLSTPAVSPTP